MIEFLSNESWINPQIDFLLYLQNIRICYFDRFNDLFLSVTIIGEFWLPTLICALVYWCIDIKAGIYLFSLSSFNVLIAQLFKMLACVYRPWVLSDKIKPVGKALALAAGYSFPSGHSAQASSLLGGLAFLCRKKTIIVVLLVLLTLTVGFSRMWLGVHTPQDVIVGLIIGFSLVFILNSIINWAEKDKNRYLYLSVITNAVVVLVLAYICYYNRYPYDYINGQLLVNPLKSIQAAILCYAYSAGILNGAFLCRRFFPFEPKQGSFNAKLIRSLIGGICIILMFKFGLKQFFCNTCDFKLVFSVSFLYGFFITAIYPLLFKKLQKLM